jgi:hypothetical protein
MLQAAACLNKTCCSMLLAAVDLTARMVLFVHCCVDICRWMLRREQPTMGVRGGILAGAGLGGRMVEVLDWLLAP